MNNGLIEMKKRLHYNGGNTDGRIVKGKLNSMKSALWNSYQGEWITIDQRPDKDYPRPHARWRCLINSEKLTTDYDQKIISIEKESTLCSGDTFYWERTGKHWIVYTSYDEEAYFKARIRKCEYQIDVDGHKYWVWMRGQVETALIWKQKSQNDFNTLNYSLLFYITKNEETNAFFTRHKIIKFDGHNWKVAALDRYSQEGILEIYLEEYFDNTMLDNMIPPEIIVPDKDAGEPYIDGPQLVNVFDTELVYSVVDISGGVFEVDESLSKKVKITEQNDEYCKIDILSSRSMDFDLTYKKDDKILTLGIIVQSF